MKAIATVFLAALVFTGCGTREKENMNSLEGRLDSLFSLVPDFWGVVMVADKGVPVYERALGTADVNTGALNEVSSIFELASVSKQFTAMAIMILKEEGKLTLEDPVDGYFPGFPYKGITIRHLLTHTSGLPDYQEIMDKNWNKDSVASNRDNILYLIRFAPPALFEPGSKYTYSNTAYMLLGSIVEMVSGQNFVSFCKARIFAPLKMASTSIRTREEKIQLENMAWGHQYVAGKNSYIRADSFPANNYTIWLGNRVGPGRVSSTTADLLKWDRALYGEELVPPSALAEAFTPTRLNNDSLSMYGFGWELETGEVLGKIVRHSGNNPGYNTHIVRMIDKDKTVIMFSNNEHAKFDDLLEGIIKLLIRSEDLIDD